MQGAKAVLWFLALLIVFAGAGQAHRDFFGDTIGNIAMLIEAALAVGVCVGYRRYSKESKPSGVIVLAVTGSLIFGYLAWVVHPEQIMSRATDRRMDYERAVGKYMLDIQYNKIDKSDNPSEVLARLQKELTLRTSEDQATYLRHRDKSATGYSWFFGLVASALAGYAGLIYRRSKQRGGDGSEELMPPNP